GFYSKDLILEVITFNGSNIFIYFIIYISVGLTVSYSIRLIYYTIIININSYANQRFREDKFINLSILFLVIMSIVRGR
ncbi:hypothetical protein ACUWC2_28940, partial [Klebsiella pneumoniae]|uniref:hypothetical protein n=1 Tax=Klebsiella pneumoniae TaxID=573 RepID=UPI0040559663